ncbi:MAG: MoaD/ThiS family protein [Flavobacteriales bacterium]
MSATINILAFGRVAEILGASSLELPHVPSVNELKRILEEKFPALMLTKYAIAVDKKLITADAVITASANIALLPPFSGG